jgi:hypothetical protein
MPVLSLSAVNWAFAQSGTPRDIRRYRCASRFDTGLEGAATAACAQLAHELTGEGYAYGWTAEPGAFASGIEAWMQYEVMRAVRLGRPARDRNAIVVRIVDKLSSDSVVVRASGCYFVLISNDVVDSHFALLRAMQSAALRAVYPYEREDAWTSSNLIGGGQVEALIRRDLSAAFAVMEGLLSWEAAYAGARLLEDPERWIIPPEQAVGGDASRLGKEQLTMIDRLVQAPLRFLLYRKSAMIRLVEYSEKDGRLSRGISGDLLALIDLLSVEGRRNEKKRNGYGAAAGMAVGLQLMRLRRIHVQTRETVFRLCVPQYEPQLGLPERLARTEVQLRCMQAMRLAFGTLEDPGPGLVLIGLVDEMQVMIGLVSARTLAKLGGGADLTLLCTSRWRDFPIHAAGWVNDLWDEVAGNSE